MTSVTDNFRATDRMEGRTLVIDGAEFADSREKLEAEVSNFGFIMNLEGYQLDMIYGWLDRQSAITRRECEAACSSCEDDQDSLVCQMAEESADLQAQLDEVTRAYKERGRIIAELREQLRNDDEPFCETVKRWLSEDAPEECLECEDGCWRDMHELMARECDGCGPMHAAEREIRELKAFCERIENAVANADDLTLFDMDYVPAFKLEGLPKTAEECEACQDAHDRLMYSSGERIKELEAERGELKKQLDTMRDVAREFRDERDHALAWPDCDCCNWTEEREPMQKVIQRQADSFKAMEVEIAYWRGQLRKCLEAAKVGNLDNLMAYPPKEGLSEPSLMVTSVIDELRDYSADTAKLEKELEAEHALVVQLQDDVDHAKACPDCDCCSWRELLVAMKAERDERERKYDEQKRRLQDKQRENAAQRDELARLNAPKRRSKRIPKKVCWPRNENGKLIGLGHGGARCIEFDKTGCTVYWDWDDSEHRDYRSMRRTEREYQMEGNSPSDWLRITKEND